MKLKRVGVLGGAKNFLMLDGHRLIPAEYVKTCSDGAGAGAVLQRGDDGAVMFLLLLIFVGWSQRVGKASHDEALPLINSLSSVFLFFRRSLFF